MKNKIIITAMLLLPAIASMAQGLTIQSGATFRTSGNISIVVENGNLINNGNGDLASSNIYIKGTTGGMFTGTTPLSIQNLYINKTAGLAKIGNDLAVQNQVVLQAGVLDLNGKNINLSPTGSLAGETETNRIISPLGGTIGLTVNLNAPLAENPGNLGATFTSSEDFGSVVIRRGHKQQTSGPGKSIFRYYDITPTNNVNLATIFRINYLDAELDGIAESGLKFFKSTNNGVSFTDAGFNSRNTVFNFVNKSNVNSFARFTLTSDAFSLPVSIISFTALCINDNTIVKFRTAQEVNLEKFVVQRSANAIQWYDLNTQLPSGGSTGREYTFTDASAVGAANYYRLKSVDADGSFTYSAVQKVNACKNRDISVKIQPVPVSDNSVVVISSVKETSGDLQIINAAGAQLIRQKIMIKSGINKITPDLRSLPAGSYYLIIVFEDRTRETISFVK